MKKTVSILVVVLFLGSIVFVGLFGSALFGNPDYIIKKVEAIEFDVEAMKIQDNITVTNTRVTSNGEQVVQGERTVQNTVFKLAWKVVPDDATNQQVDIIINTMPDDVSINLDKDSEFYGQITFGHTMGELRVVILVLKSTDGTEKTNTIIIAVV